MMEDGPWFFRNLGVVIKEYDSISNLSTVSMDRLPICIQIHDRPERYRK